jgi:hypothetical protein
MIPYNQQLENHNDQQQQQHAMVDRNMATRGETTDTYNGYKVPGITSYFLYYTAICMRWQLVHFRSIGNTLPLVHLG